MFKRRATRANVQETSRNWFEAFVTLSSSMPGWQQGTAGNTPAMWNCYQYHPGELHGVTSGMELALSQCMGSVNWDALSMVQKRNMLENVGVYPDQPEHVECIETHLSWVLLTKRYAYKVKKPVAYGPHNYRTLQLRFKDGLEEIKQNRRLAEGLYYGLVPLTYSADEGFKAEGSGQVVEWMIKMRKLPAEQMLDCKIWNHTWTISDIESVVDRLAIFYTGQNGVLTDGEAYLHRLQAECEFNYRYFSKHPYQWNPDLLLSLHEAQIQMLGMHGDLLEERARKGHVIEAHGDLRPEHICIEGKGVVSIFDCLQFDPEIRKMDSIDELSFLSLECERKGAPEIGALLMNRYRKITNDDPPGILPSFYKSYRACIWARLALERTRELEKAKWDKWIHRANEYLRLAVKHSEVFQAFHEPKEDLQLIH